MLGIQKAGGDIGNNQATYCLGFATGITLRKLVRSATLDVVDGMAQLLEVLVSPSPR